MKTVLITGCSPGGIGHELAREYHSKGCRVIATARRREALLELALALGDGLETFELDVTDVTSIRAVRDAVASMTGGTLDVLVNNAGQGYSVPATDVDMDEVKAVFDVNVFGVMSMVQEFAPLLIASGDGRIVNIGSISGIMPYPFGSAYNASKAALHAYGNTLRLEMAPFNVQVTTILTGGVKSNISSHKNRRLVGPDSIYAPIADILAERRVARSQSGAMPTSIYAKHIVEGTLRPRVRPWIWKGSFSFFCWFIDTFVGRTGFDWLFSWNFGLHALRDILSKQRTD
ncbi:NAD(P)-binding protein [Roridomyces roridus]|uniref:NAD(P)-binding protein n=1 Tax=Roridomyces roridus TaxID=1738132 RepID=A0AAD7F7N8_9AGAR|nr:NAD(P)-binding protein [Roridomyces roridus]